MVPITLSLVEGLHAPPAQSGKFERDDQAVLGCDIGWLHVTSHHALGNVDQLPHQRLQCVAVRGMLQMVHLVIGIVGE